MRALISRVCSRALRQVPTVASSSTIRHGRPQLFQSKMLWRCMSSKSTEATTAATDATDLDAMQFDGEDMEKTKEKEPVLIEETEKVVGEAKSHAFQAETRKLLDIVAKSLYSEKAIFVREIISNASDALEKLRYMQSIGETIVDPDVPLEIQISVDPEKKTFTIVDTGIGMSAEELQENLGTIARSGSKSFIENLGSEKNGNSSSSNIIGQFGVGFYSVFMVGTNARVYSKSAKPEHGEGHQWKSDGSGVYDLAPAEGVTRGTKIVIDLRDDASSFSEQMVVEEIIKKYSNFVGFPIRVNGTVINTVQPIWTMIPSDVTEDMHKDFFSFISESKSWQSAPLFHFHYQTDAPLQLRSLFYVPTKSDEVFGTRDEIEPGVSLYSRKVLIQSNSRHLLPSWLRFVKGVVDSEDIPMNLSRELLQDSRLIAKMKDVLSGRLVKFFIEKAKKDKNGYNTFYNEFSKFLKEGACMDRANQEGIAKLLRFESSLKERGDSTGFADYSERAGADQDKIYYLVSTNRQIAESSPYFESFKEKGTEVLFLYDGIDDMVMNQLNEFGGKKIVSIESNLNDTSDDTVDKDTLLELREWMVDTVGKKVLKAVKVSSRLRSAPAIVVDHESAAMRAIMKMSMRSNPGMDDMPEMPRTLEINATHPLIKLLDRARTSDPETAELVAKQLLDTALLAAGVLDEPRSMINRLNQLTEKALNNVVEVPASQNNNSKPTPVEGELVE